MYRELIEIDDKYTVHRIGNVYELDTRMKPTTVCRGDEQTVRAFMARHPYGLKRSEREQYAVSK